MARRFFVPQLLDQSMIRLEGAEAIHLSRVMRFQVGDEVALFDGRGTVARARIDSVADGIVELTIQEQKVVPEVPVTLTLATAVPKGERFDWLVEKAVELGVSRIVPLITARSVVTPGAGKLERLRRTIVEASKQCERSQLMELSEPVRWSDWLERTAETECSLWIADPAGVPANSDQMPTCGDLAVVIGPEGGLTLEEIGLSQRHGAQLVSLGRWILRIETAAIAFAALFAARANES